MHGCYAGSAVAVGDGAKVAVPRNEMSADDRPDPVLLVEAETRLILALLKQLAVADPYSRAIVQRKSSVEAPQTLGFQPGAANALL